MQCRKFLRAALSKEPIKLKARGFSFSTGYILQDYNAWTS